MLGGVIKFPKEIGPEEYEGMWEVVNDMYKRLHATVAPGLEGIDVADEEKVLGIQFFVQLDFTAVVTLKMLFEMFLSMKPGLMLDGDTIVNALGEIMAATGQPKH